MENIKKHGNKEIELFFKKMFIENIKKQKNQKYKTKKEEINTENKYNISWQKKQRKLKKNTKW